MRRTALRTASASVVLAFAGFVTLGPNGAWPLMSLEYDVNQRGEPSPIATLAPAALATAPTVSTCALPNCAAPGPVTVVTALAPQATVVSSAVFAEASENPAAPSPARRQNSPTDWSAEAGFTSPTSIYPVAPRPDAKASSASATKTVNGQAEASRAGNRKHAGLAVRLKEHKDLAAKQGAEKVALKQVADKSSGGKPKPDLEWTQRLVFNRGS